MFEVLWLISARALPVQISGDFVLQVVAVGVVSGVNFF
jgi:hypothetical protein